MRRCCRAPGDSFHRETINDAPPDVRSHSRRGSCGAWSWLESGPARSRAGQLAPQAAVTPAAIRIGSMENSSVPAPSASTRPVSRLPRGTAIRRVLVQLVDALAAVHQCWRDRVALSGIPVIFSAACRAFTGPGRALVTGSRAYEQRSDRRRSPAPSCTRCRSPGTKPRPPRHACQGKRQAPALHPQPQQSNLDLRTGKPRSRRHRVARRTSPDTLSS